MRFWLLTVIVLCLATTARAAVTHLRLEDEIDDESVAPLLDGIANAPHEKGDVVQIEINSPGGEIDAGFKLTKAIERYPAKVVCIVDGEADSMASYVLASCDVRAMTRRSVLMIHQPLLGAHGQVVDIQNALDWITVLTSSMAEHYAYHMRLISAVELAAKIANGRSLWLDWKAAQRLGAVDVVVDKVEDLK